MYVRPYINMVHFILVMLMQLWKKLCVIYGILVSAALASCLYVALCSCLVMQCYDVLAKAA